jgi:hypothetical protein
VPTFATGTITEILAERPGLQKVRVDLGGPGPERAYVLTQLTPPVSLEDRVVVNTTAVELGLGTGGWHFVHWNLSIDGWDSPGPGHIMKLRYTSLQADTGAAEEDHPEPLPEIGGTPVVACGLHSQMACVAAAFAATAPGKRLAYVMTDGAALPLALSDLVADLVERDLLAGTVTCGHAFGGDLEAVSLAAALPMARHLLGADAVVVAMGPGVVGTGTKLGNTGTEVAAILDTAAALHGDPILCLRVSSGEQRDRHLGVSHHAITALELCRTTVTVPISDPDHAVALPVRHHPEPVEVPDMSRLLDAHGLRVTTMGRGPGEDPAFFAAAGAAGVTAARRTLP